MIDTGIGLAILGVGAPVTAGLILAAVKRATGSKSANNNGVFVREVTCLARLEGITNALKTNNEQIQSLEICVEKSRSDLYNAVNSVKEQISTLTGSVQVLVDGNKLKPGGG